MKNNITGKASIAIDAPASKVWEALITPSIIKQYFFGTTAISDWNVGSPLLFIGEWEGKEYEDKGTILEKVPQRLFRYTYWSSMSGIKDTPENYVIITYELNEKDNETSLTITQENIPDEKTREHSEQNWNKVLGDLKRLLEKKSVRREKTPAGAE
ncbi:MAG: SRPBCC family protein [Bacteroidota bacterium]